MSLVDLGFNTTVQISHPKPLDLGATNRRQNREVAQALVDLIQGGSNGTADQLTCIANQSGMGSKAGATLLLSGGSGAVGGIINGVTVTATWASSDINSAGLIATAINASSNALVQGFVRASNVAASVTLATMTAGSTISVRVGSGAVASTYTFTATAAATSRMGEFSIAGTDTQDAQAFCDILNATSGINQVIRAENVAGVAFLYAMDGSSSSPAKVVTVSGSGISLTAQFAAVARVHIEALMPDARGNAITIALSGTGVTVANTNTRLVGGAGGVTGTVKRANVGGAQ